MEEPTEDQLKKRAEIKTELERHARLRLITEYARNGNRNSVASEYKYLMETYGKQFGAELEPILREYVRIVALPRRERAAQIGRHGFNVRYSSGPKQPF